MFKSKKIATYDVNEKGWIEKNGGLQIMKRMVYDGKGLRNYVNAIRKPWIW